ncbi:hypothetical protein [Spirosoma pulveris]
MDKVYSFPLLLVIAFNPPSRIQSDFFKMSLSHPFLMSPGEVADLLLFAAEKQYRLSTQSVASDE